MNVVIAWRSRQTGETGQGEPMPRATAEAWLAYLKAEHPELEHWIEVLT